jgi:hypothetical protein
VSYARTLEIINGYTVEFEDGQYVARCIGANHNLADVKVLNQVSLVIGNSAGLVVAGGGTGAPTAADVAAGVWSFNLPTGNTAASELLATKTAASNAFAVSA